MALPDWVLLVGPFLGAATPAGLLLFRVGAERAAQLATNQRTSDSIEDLTTKIAELEHKIDSLRDDKIQVAVIERDVQRLKADVLELRREISGTVHAVRHRSDSRHDIEEDDE